MKMVRARRCRPSGGFATSSVLVAALIAATAYGAAADPSDKSRGGGVVPPPLCEQFALREAGSSLQDIAATFSISLPDLQALNPHLKLSDAPAAGVATPLCVVGSVASQPSSKGKRPKTLSAYAAKAGRGQQGTTCLDLIARADPPLDFATFVALNPNLDCRTIADGTSVYLPKGTIIEAAARPKKPRTDNTDCAVGPWGDWTDCSPDGTQSRYRTIYRDAAGTGKPCPETFETRECSGGVSSSAAAGGPSRRRALLPAYLCPASYNGCSVPPGLPYYQLFTPACNLHDICYSCDRHAGWEFAYNNRGWCDNMWRDKMISMCNTYWSKWWQAVDKGYCRTMAEAYWAGVSVFGASYFESENGPNGLYMDGCRWRPWEPEINNVAGGGFHPGWAGCPCIERACLF